MTPIHPKLVHFPVALIITAFMFIVLAIFFTKKRELFIQLTFWNLAIGTLSSIIALITGLLEESKLVHNNAIHEIMETHKLLGIIVLAVATVLLIWLGLRIKKMKINEIYFFAVILFMLSSTLGYTAHLGGKMVYEEGAGVIPMEQIISSTENDHEHSPNEEHSDPNPVEKKTQVDDHDHEHSSHDH